MQKNSHWILISSFLITLVIFLNVLIYSLSQLEEFRNKSRDIVEKNNTKSELIFTMLSSARERVVGLFAMVNTEDSFKRDEIFLDFNIQGARFARSRGALLSLNLNSKEKGILKKQGEYTGVSVPIQLKLIDLIQEESIDEAKVLLNEKGIEAQDKVLDELLKLLELQKKSSRDILSSIDYQYEQSNKLILIWSFVSFFIGVLLAVIVSLKIYRAERNLFDEFENKRAILKSISDIVIRINNSREIVYANDKAKEVFGEDIVGDNIFAVISWLSEGEMFSQSDKPNLGVFKYEKGNRLHWLEILQETIKNENGELVGKVLVFRDITEIQNAQKKLESTNVNLEKRVEERTENLQKTNEKLSLAFESLKSAQGKLIHSEKMAALGSLVAGISHEVNTPLGISVTSATNIEEKVSLLENEFNSGTLTKTDFESFMSQTRKGLDILISNLKRASDLIKSFKQVAVDQSSDDLRDINLREYLDSIILSLNPKFKNRNVDVNNNVPEDVFVYTNPGALYQIISNLIVNSLIHAFDEDSDNSAIDIDASLKKNNLNIIYHDNGHGISKEVMNRIFEPFYTTKRGQGGSGLGMNVVYNLVTSSLHGQINVESTPGDGLSINMVIPITSEGG